MQFRVFVQLRYGMKIYYVNWTTRVPSTSSDKADAYKFSERANAELVAKGFGKHFGKPSSIEQC